MSPLTSGTAFTPTKPWSEYNTDAAPREDVLTRTQPFHNDMGCDTLALQVRQSVDSGGDTYLASTWTVFNKLLTDEPDVARTLLDPSWPVQL